MATESDSVGKASVEIEATIVISEESKAEAKAQLAELANADVSTPEGKRARKGSGGSTTVTQNVEAKVTKVTANVARDIQAAIDKDQYQLTIDTGNIREQITNALKAPFQITLDAEIKGALAHEGVGLAHGAAVATGAPMGRGAPPPEIAKLLTTGMKDAIDNVYRNVNEAYEAAGKGRFGRQAVAPGAGSQAEKAIELIDRFGGKFSDMLQVETNKTGIPSRFKGPLSPAELGKFLGLDPKHDVFTALKSNAMGLMNPTTGGVSPTRNADSLFSMIDKWAKATPMAAQPAAAVDPAQATPRHENRAMAREEIAKTEESIQGARQAVIDERQHRLTQQPLSSAEFPVTPPLMVPRGATSAARTMGPHLPADQAAAQAAAAEDLAADRRARYALGGNERANVRRKRGRGTPVAFGAQSVDLEGYLRAAEMGQFEDVYEKFGGKGNRESQGLIKFNASDADAFDELSRLGKRKPGVKFGMAGQEGRYARVNPSEALIRTIIKDLGIGEDVASSEQVRSELGGRQGERISQAVGQGSNPRRPVSGATKRGQGSVDLMGGGDAAKRLQLFDEWVSYAEDRSAQLAERLAKITPAIERASKKRDTRKVQELEEAARGISSEMQSLDSGIADAVIDRRELLEAANPKEQLRLTKAQIARRNKLSQQGVAEGVGMSDAEKLDRQLRSPGAQGRFGKLLMGELGMEDPGEQIRSALLQRYLGDADRPEGRTGRSTMRQAAFGPSGRARRAPGADEGILGELMTAAPDDLGRDATKTLRDSIVGILNATLEDEGFKRDVAESEIAKKEGATLRPLRIGMTGEGTYTRTPPGVLGALRAKIGVEESFPVGHGASAHGPNTDTHEELEDKLVAGGKEDPSGSAQPIVLPGLRSRLRQLEERDIKLKDAEEKAAATRQRSIAGKGYQTGDDTTAISRAAGVTQAQPEGQAPWASFIEKYGGGVGGGAGGARGGDLGRLMGGGTVPVNVMNWPAGFGGGGGGRPPRGRVTAEGGDEQPPPGDETPKAAKEPPARKRKNIRYRDTGTMADTGRIYTYEPEGENPPNESVGYGPGFGGQAAYHAGMADRGAGRQTIRSTTSTQSASPAESDFLAALATASKASAAPGPAGFPRMQIVDRLETQRRAARESRGPSPIEVNRSEQSLTRQRERETVAEERRRQSDLRAQRRLVRINNPDALGLARDLSDDELTPTRAKLRSVQRRVPRRGFGASLTDLVTSAAGGNAFERQLEFAGRAEREAAELGTLYNQRDSRRVQRAGFMGQAREARAADNPEGVMAAVRSAKDVNKELVGLGKSINRSNVNFDKAASAAGGAATVLKSFGAAAVGSIVSTGIGALTVGLGMAVAAPLIQGVGEGISAALGPVVERLSGFAGTTGRVQTDVATGFRASNDDIRATLAQQGIVARLNDQQLAAVGGPLGQRGQTVAGTQSLQQQFDLFNASQAIGRQGQGGLDRSLFRSTGGIADIALPFKAFGVQDISIGGQASTAEALTGQLQTLATPQDIAGAGGKPPGILDSFLGEDFKSRGLDDQTKANKLIEENSAQLKFLNANLKDFELIPSEDQAALDKQALVFAEGGARDLGGRLRERGVLAQGVGAPGDVGKFLQQFAQGPQLSPQALLDLDHRAIQAQKAVEDMQRQLQIQTVNPQQFAMSQVAAPLAPAATGINTAGLSVAQVKEVNANLADTQKLYDGINTDVQKGIADAKSFVASTFAGSPEIGVEFGKSLDHVAAIGKEISGIEIGLQTKQAAYSAAQFTYQISLANRSLQDAKGLTGDITKQNGDNLGILERQQFLLQRESQAMGLALSQKQINFNVAAANFQAPGLTSEERKARRDQAKIEADYAQKQLDIQRKLFGLAGQQFKMSGSRQVRDLNRQLDLLERGRSLSIDTAVAEKRIIALTKIQARENKSVETYYNSAITRTGDIQAEIGKLVAATGKAMNDVATIVLKEFESVYTGMISTISGDEHHQGTAPGATSGDDEHHQGNAPGNAKGFLGTVSGSTSLGKLGVVGESAGEAVAILKNPQQLVSPMNESGGDTFIVQIYNPVVKSDDDKTRLISDVKRAIQKEASMLLPRRA